MVSSAPTIMRQQVWILSTPYTLFSISNIDILMRKDKNEQQEAGIGPFFMQVTDLFKPIL